MRFVLLVSLYLLTTELSAQTRRIVTYIDEVQEERRSTRWTLTEWLRIKERMKLMDVWLAMFSDPGKSKFSPELSLSYGRTGGESRFDLGLPETFESSRIRTIEDVEGEDMRLQFWFTNLVSGTTGLRTLDVDLGFEGKIVSRFHNTTLDQNLDSEVWQANTARLQQAGVNLRLFGDSSQDSTLVGKVGKYNQDLGLIQVQQRSGVYYGGELALYLLSFLGVEGNYYQYLDGKAKLGESVDAFAFLEIYNVRIGYGMNQQRWEERTEGSLLKIKNEDRFMMIRLYL